VDAFEPDDPAALGFVTQTTLSVDDTADVIERLNQRFPANYRASGGIDLLCHHQPPGCGQAGCARL
jgi:4-hydroxy-3-methylbut-2-enyl diphosphate reductase IspH